MSIQTLGTLLILVGVILGIALVILIAIGVMPLFDAGTKQRVSGSPARKATASHGSLGRPANGVSDRRPLS